MAGDGGSLLFLLQTLKEQWIDYKNLKDGAKHEFEQLKTALSEFEAYLKDTATVSEKNNLFRVKESRIRELVYDVEDTIEICLTKKASAKSKSFISTSWGKLSTEMEQDVKNLRQQKVQPILDEINRQNEVKERNHGSSSSLPTQMPEVEMEMKMDESTGQQSSPEQSKLQENVVDFQDEGTIIGILMEPKDRLDVISITGMAGLGKTTFARKIYEHKDVVTKFKLRIWIHVSQKFDSTEVFRSILKQITLKDTFSTSKQDLIVSVRESLRKRDFLLVTDDVWTKEDWQDIEKILSKNNGKGKVLVTTRETEVAAEANVIRTPHQLKPLNNKESLELLKLQVFDNLEDCHEELEKVGQVIAERCRGVPLIILVIGGILKSIFTNTRGIHAVKEEWLKVSRTVNEILEKDERKLISRALELSYKRLGHDLRVCFLYSGLFPENHEIPVSTLTQLWIAEGFVQRKEGERESLEQKAEKILDTLIKMNLLMAAKKNLQQVKTCWVHDMIREFCRAKAMEEKLFRVIKGSIGGPNPPVVEVSDFRRLCFDSDPSEFLSKDVSGKHVRSLLCFYEKSVNLQGAVTFPDVCNFLRVLNCRSTKFHHFPEVKKLILLKHVTLFIENLRVLPEYISQLVNLQTLIVDTNLRSITVKANISKMIRLRLLKTKAAIFLDGKNWKGKACQNLQTFSRLSPQSCKPDLSKRAPNLKRLGVRGILASLVQTMFLKDFPHLEKLKLMNDLDDKSEPSNPLVLTELGSFPQKLESLTLSKTYLQWNIHMRLLAKIENLKVLKLKDNAFTGEDWVANEADGFSSLQCLLIENSDLVNWNASESYFPKLRSLVIKNCEKLLEIPQSLAKHELESLEIDRVNKSVVDSAKKIKENQTKKNQKFKWEIPFKLTIGPECDLFSGIIKPKIAV